MHVFGLTGGIASGKSTVTRMLRELGAQVLDADVLAREVVEPGTPGLAAVAARFPGVVGPDGRLDRAKLGAHIFATPTERAALNAITHPLVREAFIRRVQALEAQGVERVIYDVPLLIESGMHAWMAGVALVWVPRDVQKARLMSRDGLDSSAAEARLAAQLPLDDKRAHATWVIDNSAGLDATRAQVEAMWRAMLAHG
ncbi:dephospho-CoA kinase [Corallococcus sp. H22C18031201]|uniref:dephospho-CoA kinase n=1 Tax=Citreicoccus inhibens TaxID=2849499 RepID=UPI000E74CDB9|nr:dephospho-CoA kinase [Citreicoccus inhibens]MBU8900107.1 dephospho-CoA kinase [Citreicoccus inhibens]RJS20705.1 dephospho-CoA kinase [Corallococcus sp. H22C18031201]